MKKEILGSWWNQREQGGCFHGLHESQVSWNTTAIRHPLPGTKPAGTWSPAAWWGWILLFICAVWQKCKNVLYQWGKGGTPQVCCWWWDVKGLFPHFLGMGEVFWCDNDVLSSLLPLKGTFGNDVRFWGEGRQIPPFFHPLSHMWQIHACSTSRFYLLTKFYFPSVSVYIA